LVAHQPVLASALNRRVTIPFVERVPSENFWLKNRCAVLWNI
jgi:hypothetical protein